MKREPANSESAQSIWSVRRAKTMNDDRFREGNFTSRKTAKSAGCGRSHGSAQCQLSEFRFRKPDRQKTAQMRAFELHGTEPRSTGLVSSLGE